MKIETQEHLLKQLDLKEVDESLDKKDSHENDSRLFECKECGVKSEGRRGAWEHIRWHKLSKCTKCEKKIKTKSLLRHNRICGQNDESDQNIHILSWGTSFTITCAKIDFLVLGVKFSLKRFQNKNSFDCFLE